MRLTFEPAQVMALPGSRIVGQDAALAQVEGLIRDRTLRRRMTNEWFLHNRLAV
jgi:hypothetical protein